MHTNDVAAQKSQRPRLPCKDMTRAKPKPQRQLTLELCGLSHQSLTLIGVTARSKLGFHAFRG
jgi:hypothetical protein